ncbi:glycoside hydrolase family 2 TIM barrel-domain containing protein [Persicobacter diffluens]|uniref:Beta-glucuronidase n=1 Tax=Persicobacter diffluens TaxID=981 RepID=A0AAN4W4G2_9BACT|nr:beta-glucuronidase [Persicobacter diffluens]
MTIFKNTLLAIIGMLALVNVGFAQSPLIQNVYNREALSLNGDWNYIVDPYENGYYDYRRIPFDKYFNPANPGSGAYFANVKPAHKTDRVEYDFDLADKIKVPGSWSVEKEPLHWYEGTVWYQKDFIFEPTAGEKSILHFGAVNYEAEVYVNGIKVGTHVGGFTPFNFDVTEQLKAGDNFVVVKVDNTRKKDAVPTINTDWWNHGGITREVKLIQVPEVFVADYSIQLSKTQNNLIEGSVQLSEKAAGQSVHIAIPELKINKELTTNAEGKAEFAIKAKKITKWHVDKPYLYDVNLSAGQDVVSDRIGFRTIEVQGSDILLNGEKLYLRGICMHEENPIEGRRNYSLEDARMMFQWSKDLNANFVRLAHYPHNENMPRLADELGILLWEEIPVYWTIDWTNEETLANAKGQLTEMVQRDRNRASVIIWSMANETPVSEERNQFLKALVETTRSLDNSRLISAAMEVHGEEDGTKMISDPFGEYVDIMSFNQYHGWYGGDIEDFPNLKWAVKYNKPVVVSEWGAGAKYGYRADDQTIWSEDYQAYFYQKTLEGINNIPNLAGFTPWILADFRSPRRPLANIQDMWNRKGLISEGGFKKQAFFVLKDYYDQKEAKGNL